MHVGVKQLGMLEDLKDIMADYSAVIIKGSEASLVHVVYAYGLFRLL